MHKFGARFLPFLIALLLLSARAFAQAPGLYVNEVSQGASGAKEYVELVVVATPSCAGIPTLDLRGWYIDDNNGTHATGSGTGIASGCLRFSQNALWAAVPAGTLIVIYNDADINPSVPANDLSMTDGNCRLVIPANNCTLLEKNVSQPSTANATYPTTGFTGCGNWTNLSMANGDDSFHTVTPAGTVFHAVSWGNNTLATNIYFAGSSAGQVAFMTNASSANIVLQANWTRLSVAGNETPGAPNNTANQAWITVMNNNCTPLVPLALNLTATTAGCTCTGTASAAVTGGIGSYTYAWQPASIGNTATVTNLCPGTYTLTVTDMAGCTDTQVISVIGSPSFTLAATTTPVTCNGGTNGSATVTPAGGNGPFTYAWSPSGGNTPTATGLSAGAYTCAVTDANGCTSTVSVTITQPTAISLTTSSTLAACNQNTGTANVSVTGGAGNYTYAWSNGPTTATNTNLAAGNYTIIVTDANNCSATTTVTVGTTPAVTATLSNITNVNCNSGNTGSATVTPNSGNGPFTYAWLPSGGNTPTATGLSAGAYTCAVTDANGCTSTVSVTITQPVAISLTTSSTLAACNQNIGTATVAATGGVGNYTYAWSNGPTTATNTNLAAGNYTIIVTDANSCTATATVTVGATPAVIATVSNITNVNCNGGNTGSATVTPNSGNGPFTYVWLPSGGNTPTATGLSAGAYTCAVTDANGCTSTVSVTITQPTAISLTTSSTLAACNQNTGTANVSATGGAGNYTYAWSNGPTTATNTNLAAGNYTVIITDANNCSATATVTVGATAGVTTSITNISNVSCNGFSDGSITTTSVGGQGPYTYAWSAPASSVTGTATNLAAGSYLLLVSDANGCTSTVTATITQPTVLSVAASATTPLVCAGSTVQLNAVATGGNGGNVFTWAPGSLSGNAPTFTPTTSGTYTVTVTDGNSCTATGTVALIVAPLPVVNFTADTLFGCTPLCVNFSDLSTTMQPATISSWSWNFGDASAAATVQNPNHCYTTAGSFDLTLSVTSTAGCSATLTVPAYITTALPPVAAFTAGPQPFTITEPTVQFTSTSSNAVTWNWSFGDVNNSASQLPNPQFTYPAATCYTVRLEVTNAAGCTDQTTQDICLEPEVTLYVPNSFTPDGDGLNDVFLPVGSGLNSDDYELLIYDRWGQLVFSTNNIAIGWDGRVQGHAELVQMDTYVWKLRVRAVTGNPIYRMGHVNVIR